jgi:hypothetical protein
VVFSDPDSALSLISELKPESFQNSKLDGQFYRYLIPSPGLTVLHGIPSKFLIVFNAA